MKNIRFKYSSVESVKDSKPVEETVSWNTFVQKCKTPVARGDMPLKQYLKCKKDPKRKHLADAQKDGTAIIPGTFSRKGTKSKNHLDSRTLLVLDLDDGFYSFKSLKKKFKKFEFECVIHTSYSHSKMCPKFRVFILFDKPVTKDIEATVSRMLDYFETRLGPHIDQKCWTVSQIYYTCSCPTDAVDYYRAKHIKGKAIRTTDFKMKLVDQEFIEMACKPTGDRPGDDYNRRADWNKILEKLGWRYLFTGRTGDNYFAHPSKGKGISGVVFKNSNAFHNFSSNPDALPFQADTTYSPFKAYAMIEHGGDVSAAASQLKSEGFGNTTDGVNNPIEDAARDRVLNSFPEIPFPLDVMPQYFEKLVTNYAEGFQCPPAFMSMIFLTIVSCAAGNAVGLKIKRKWRTAPFIWFYIIGATGDGKSPPENAAIEPIYQRQALEKVRYNNEMQQYKQDVAAYKKDPSSDLPIEPQNMRHYYSSNFTIEALIPMFQSHSRGILLHVDELAGLFNSMNQYRGGKGADVEQFLTLFDCKPIKSDRKGGTNYCNESGVAIISGIQRKKLPQIFNDKMHDNGMVYRFLPMFLNIPPQPFNEEDISKTTEIAWLELIDWMYAIDAPVDDKTGCIIKTYFTVKGEGRTLWTEFYDNISALREFMPEQFKGYIPKLITYSIKFMALLHLLSCYEKNKLTKKVKKSTVKGAINLTYYFAGQAMLLVSNASPKQNDPYNSVIRTAVISLKDEFNKKGRLPLKRMREKVNESLPQGLVLDDRDNRIGSWLRKMGFEVEPGTGNRAEVIWNPDIVC